MADSPPFQLPVASSVEALSLAEAVQRLSCRDPNLDYIKLERKRHTDEELAELADCLLAHPDVATRLCLGDNQLTDETGVKLARYLAASSTIQALGLFNNEFGSATYLAVAAALHVNTSLDCLLLDGNLSVDRRRIDAAFIEALRLNPDRPADSNWELCTIGREDFERLRHAAEQLGHPSLQLLLAVLPDEQLTTRLRP